MAGCTPSSGIRTGDTTPSITIAAVSPTPNSNGWNNTNVTVNFDLDGRTWRQRRERNPRHLYRGSDGERNAWSSASLTITAEGTTTLTYFAVDNAENSEAAKSLTLKIDKTAPVISGLPAPGCTLWPPDQKFVQVGTVTAADALSGLASGTFKITGTSNEPSNDPQILITPNGSGGYVVQLQANRLGTGTGRVYTLTATANDLAGNPVTATATCAVPLDQSKR